MSNRSTPTYLGDGLYVAYDGWQVELFCHNGIERTNAVYLEPDVLARFLEYAKAIPSGDVA